MLLPTGHLARSTWGAFARRLVYVDYSLTLLDIESQLEAHSAQFSEHRSLTRIEVSEADFGIG